jgi:hypothetical protein
MMQNSRRWPDRLSEWTLPPPAAWAAGDAEPVRVFDTAEAALAFLDQRQGGARFGPAFPNLANRS